MPKLDRFEAEFEAERLEMVEGLDVVRDADFLKQTLEIIGPMRAIIGGLFGTKSDTVLSGRLFELSVIENPLLTLTLPIPPDAANALLNRVHERNGIEYPQDTREKAV